jgi:polysaccharide deacetylase 2 family uncharacterized protein YibQ
MKPAEFRLTLILLASILGLSAILLAGKCFLYPSKAPAAVPSQSVGTLPSPENPPVSSPSAAIPRFDGESTAAEEPAEPAAVSSGLPSPGCSAANLPPDAPSVAPAPIKPTVLAAPIKPPVPPKPVLQSAPQVRALPSSLAVSAPPPERPHPVKRKGTILFVFDDAGNNLKQLEPFLKLPFPCTIAVLPGLQYSKETARRVRAAGKEVILHQPMQAINLSMDPGPGALKKGMSSDQIKAIVRKNLAEVGPVVGLNNHEGSLVTADRRSMEAVLDVVREKRIYFLDSRTTAGTVAPVIARERNMTIWERAVFLDNSQDKAAIIEAVMGGMKIAEKKGTAVMIGHIWSNDLANILTSMYPELVSQGFSLSTIADIATNGDFDE